ncbi:MAG: hypothetical protein HY329_27050 [Chloroflexi bacterium]|nr:hypothetical protein [Chloroflexota bacterium]
MAELRDQTGWPGWAWVVIVLLALILVVLLLVVGGWLSMTQMMRGMGGVMDGMMGR